MVCCGGSCAEGRLEAESLGEAGTIDDQTQGSEQGGESRLAPPPVLVPTRPNPFLWHRLDEVFKGQVAAEPHAPGLSRAHVLLGP